MQIPYEVLTSQLAITVWNKNKLKDRKLLISITKSIKFKSKHTNLQSDIKGLGQVLLGMKKLMRIKGRKKEFSMIRILICKIRIIKEVNLQAKT